MSPTHALHKIPIYLRIKELLLREIGAGKWLRGERLPTEAELASELEVAVGTLRKALALLEAEGVLERRQGSGTYVAEVMPTKAIYHFFRLEKANGQTGFPNGKVLSVHSGTHALASQRLRLPSDTLFWVIRRVRNLDETPIAVEEIVLPQARAPALTEAELPESLYAFYREQLGFWIAQVEDAVSIGTVPAWGAEALNLPTQQVCGLVERISYDQHSQRAEFSLNWFNPEQARYLARWT